MDRLRDAFQTFLYSNLSQPVVPPEVVPPEPDIDEIMPHLNGGSPLDEGEHVPEHVQLYQAWSGEPSMDGDLVQMLWPKMIASDMVDELSPLQLT